VFLSCDKNWWIRTKGGHERRENFHLSPFLLKGRHGCPGKIPAHHQSRKWGPLHQARNGEGGAAVGGAGAAQFSGDRGHRQRQRRSLHRFDVMGKRVTMGCGCGMWLLALNLYLMMSPPNTLQQGGSHLRCPTRTLWRGESANNVACKMGRPERRSDH